MLHTLTIDINTHVNQYNILPSYIVQYRIIMDKLLVHKCFFFLLSLVVLTFTDQFHLKLLVLELYALNIFKQDKDYFLRTK